MRAILEPMVANPVPNGTMAKWCQDHDGAIVHTLQTDNRLGNVWSPLSRTLDAHTYRGKALFNGSARDYAGMRVLAATDWALIVADDWHTIAYVVVTQ